jgi:hypothetical protein
VTKAFEGPEEFVCPQCGAGSTSDDALVFGWCSTCENYTGGAKWNALDVLLLMRDLDLSLEPVVLHDSRLMRVHPVEVCGSPPCCIHSPSDHPLRTAPLSWDSDTHTMWRICKHLRRHPDPDDTMVRSFTHCGVNVEHDCDGCCTRALRAVG